MCRLALCLLVTLLPSVALAGPFGVDWGMSMSSLKAAGAECELNERNVEGFDTYQCAKLVKPFSNADFYLVYAHPTQGVQRVSMLGDTIIDDPYGFEGLDRYKAYKSALTKKYGEPTDSYEYKGEALYRDADEFYECIDYTGCGSHVSIFKKNGVSVMVKINSSGRRGRGWLSIMYEGPQYMNLVNAFEEAQNASDIDSL